MFVVVALCRFAITVPLLGLPLLNPNSKFAQMIAPTRFSGRRSQFTKPFQEPGLLREER
jgi:hypothetical protein